MIFKGESCHKDSNARRVLIKRVLMLARGGSKRVAIFLQENILIAFDFIWKVLLSNRNSATLCALYDEIEMLISAPKNDDSKIKYFRIYVNIYIFKLKC